MLSKSQTIAENRSLRYKTKHNNIGIGRKYSHRKRCPVTKNRRNGERERLQRSNPLFLCSSLTYLESAKRPNTNAIIIAKKSQDSTTTHILLKDICGISTEKKVFSTISFEEF
jgi:hypothetical protein